MSEVPVTASPNPHGFTTEATLSADAAAIDAVWARARWGEFAGVDGVALRYAICPPPERNDRPALVFCPGRTETIEKYAEVVSDLHRLGQMVYLIDPRGQGGSGRLLEDSHKGHVERFDDYIEDLEQFLRETVRPAEAGRAPVIAGHSMGGAIALRHWQRYPGERAGTAVFAPMLEIAIPIGERRAEVIARFLNRSIGRFEDEPGYVPGGGRWKALPFKAALGFNRLTRSELRYARINALYERKPSLQLGEPTRHWLIEAFRAERQIFAEAESMAGPLFMATAGADRVVTAEAQHRLIALLLSSDAVRVKTILCEDAEHELLMERDHIRLATLNALVEFIAGLDG